MVLEALVDYYQILEKEGRVAAAGYCDAKVSFAIQLSEQGGLQGIVDLRSPNGKKSIPQIMRVPEQTKRSGKNPPPYYLCDKGNYVLGILFDKEKKKVVTDPRRFDSFRKYHLKLLAGIKEKEACAVRAFLESWNPEKTMTSSLIQPYLDEIAGNANIVFRVGDRKTYVHDNEVLKEKWEEEKDLDNSGAEKRGTCLITGRESVIERIHPAIKGIFGGQSMGSTLVSFQKGDNAYESYGNHDSQGYNAHIGKKAAFAYGTVLNYLLSDRKHFIHMGDMSVVYWAKSEKTIYRDIIAGLLNGYQESEGSEELETVDNQLLSGVIGGILQAIMEGKAVEEIKELDENTRFYILGLSPNAARVSVRMYYENTFGTIIENIQRHYRDIEILPQYTNEKRYINIWQLIYETAPPSSKNKEAVPILAGSVMRAVIMGLNYPESLYEHIMMRCRADKKINYIRAAIIKGVLKRNHMNTVNEEVLQMALNEETNNKAYTLGRLFAVMEMTQREAISGIKVTIKDRYYNAASATPKNVFPTLLKLSETHYSKLKGNETKQGLGGYWQNKKEELLNRLDVNQEPFPSRLSLEDQGVFMLGYYHQMNYKKTKSDNEK